MKAIMGLFDHSAELSHLNNLREHAVSMSETVIFGAMAIGATGITAYGVYAASGAIVETLWGKTLREREAQNERRQALETIHEPAETYLADFRVLHGIQRATQALDKPKIYDHEQDTPKQPRGFTHLEESGRDPVIKPIIPEEGEQ